MLILNHFYTTWQLSTIINPHKIKINFRTSSVWKQTIKAHLPFLVGRLSTAIRVELVRRSPGRCWALLEGCLSSSGCQPHPPLPCRSPASAIACILASDCREWGGSSSAPHGRWRGGWCRRAPTTCPWNPPRWSPCAASLLSCGSDKRRRGGYERQVALEMRKRSQTN